MIQYLPQQPTRSYQYASVDVSPGLVSAVHSQVTSYGWGGDTSHSARQSGSQHSVIGTLAGGAAALLDSAKTAYSSYSAWSAQRQVQAQGSAASYKPITSNQPNHRLPQNIQYSNQHELDSIMGYHSQYGASAAIQDLSVDRFKSTSRVGRVIDGTLEGMFECMTCRCCCGGDGSSGPHAKGGGDVSGGGGGGDCCACC